MCFACKAVGHRKDSCPQRLQRRKMEGKKKIPQPVTYATIVAGQEALSEEQEFEELPEVIEIIEEDIVESHTETGSDEYLHPIACGISSEEAKEIRRKEAMEKLTEVANPFGEAISKQNASQWRAQFASSGSGSKEHSRPKKICARKSKD